MSASMPIDFQSFSVLLLHVRSGGARRDRTADPLLAKQVLSQLSYGPPLQSNRSRRAWRDPFAPSPLGRGLG